MGYKEGRWDEARLAIEAGGGEVDRRDADLRIALVFVDDPALFLRLVLASPAVEFVEADDPIRLSGTQWDGTQWDGTQWDTVKVNGVQWDGTQWDSKSQTNSNDPGRKWQWGIETVNAPGAWSITTGTRRASICVLDSGLAYDHKDIAANAWRGPDGERGYNVIDRSANVYDRAGHGTHVAGIAAAVVRNGHGISGVANVTIMPAKVLRDDGTGDESHLAFGIAWCARQGASVALMALEASKPGPSLDRAIAFASAKGVLMLAAAGNSGPCEGCVAYPARDPRVVAVAATTKDNVPASFSASGPEVELSAPGQRILSTMPGDAYAYGSGTSQAVAFAAGVAALVRDRHPDASAADVRALLTKTARDFGAEGRDDAFGHGIPDAKAAVAWK